MTHQKAIESFLNTQQLTTSVFKKLQIHKRRFLQRCTPRDDDFINNAEIVPDLCFDAEKSHSAIARSEIVHAFGANATEKISQAICVENDDTSAPLLQCFMKLGFEMLGARCIAGKIQKMQKGVTMQVAFMNIPLYRARLESWKRMAHAWLALESSVHGKAQPAPLQEESTQDYALMHQTLAHIHARIDQKFSPDIARIFKSMMALFEANTTEEKQELLRERLDSVSDSADLDSIIHRIQVHLFLTVLNKIAMAAPVVLALKSDSSSGTTSQWNRVKEIFFFPSQPLQFTKTPSTMDPISQQLYNMYFFVDFSIHEHLATYMREQHNVSTKNKAQSTSLNLVLTQHVQSAFTKSKETLVMCKSTFLFDKKWYFSVTFRSWKDWTFNSTEPNATTAQVNLSNHFASIQQSSIFNPKMSSVYVVRDMVFEQFCYHGLYTIYTHQSNNVPEFPHVIVKQPSRSHHYNPLQTEVFRLIHDPAWEGVELLQKLSNEPLTLHAEIEQYPQALAEMRGEMMAEQLDKDSLLVDDIDVHLPKANITADNVNALHIERVVKISEQKAAVEQPQSTSPAADDASLNDTQSAQSASSPPFSEASSTSSVPLSQPLKQQPIIVNLTINNYNNSNNTISNNNAFGFAMPPQISKASAPTADDIDTSTMDLPYTHERQLSQVDTRFDSLLGQDYQATLRRDTTALHTKPLPAVPSSTAVLDDDYPLSTVSMNIARDADRLKWDAILELLQEILVYCTDQRIEDDLRPLLDYTAKEMTTWNNRSTKPTRVEAAKLIELLFDLEVACGVDLSEDFQNIFGFHFHNQERRIVRVARLLRCVPEISIPFSVRLPFAVQHQFMQVVESYLLCRDNFTMANELQMQFLTMTFEALAVFGDDYIVPWTGSGQYSTRFRESIDLIAVLQKLMYWACTMMCGQLNQVMCTVSVLKFILLVPHMSILKAIARVSNDEDLQRLYCTFLTMLLYSVTFQGLELLPGVRLSFDVNQVFLRSLSNAIVLGALHNKSMEHLWDLDSEEHSDSMHWIVSTLPQCAWRIGETEKTWNDFGGANSMHHATSFSECAEYLRTRGGMIPQMLDNMFGT